MRRLYQFTLVLIAIFGSLLNGPKYGSFAEINEFGYDPSSFVKPNQLDLAVQLNMTQDAQDDFNYIYTIRSTSSSRQQLVSFRLEIGDSRVSLSDIGIDENSILTDKPGWPNGYMRTFHPRWKNTPPYFAGEISWAVKRIELHGEAAGERTYTPPQYSLKPEESMNVFFKSKGLPRVQRFWARGWVRPYTENDVVAFARYQTGDTGITNLDEISDTFYRSLPNHAGYRDAYQGHTLSPRAVPTGLSEICDTYILDLIGQVRAASELGWIKHDLRKDRDDDDDHGERKGGEKGRKNGHEKDGDGVDHADDDDDMDDADEKLPGVAPSVKRDILSRSGDDALPGIAKSIIKKLTKVRRECMRGELGGGREKLRALIKQTDAQRGKHLTDEAYYLIKFNVEFLLEKL